MGWLLITVLDLDNLLGAITRRELRLLPSKKKKPAKFAACAESIALKYVLIKRRVNGKHIA